MRRVSMPRQTKQCRCLMNSRILPTIDYLHECFSLDAKTGNLTWRWRPASHFNGSPHASERTAAKMNAIYAGKRAGSRGANGYIYVGVANMKLCGHSIVFAMANGRWQKSDEHIDHINGDRDDNRPENLRAVSQAENNQNRTALDKRNSSGFLGVSWDKSRNLWRATARDHKKNKNVQLGRFSDIQEAVTARRAYVEANYSGFVSHLDGRREDPTPSVA